MQDLTLLAVSTTGVLWTVIGLGGLIFFHELGHFVACRLTGTRVEAFSIGFGPELFGWTRGHTRYKVSLVPLGGYVKMAAENPGDVSTGAADEFPNKSFGQRLFIMSNGVIFNVILAFAFYAWAFGIGVPFPVARLGMVGHGSPAWESGLQRGDLVTHVDGRSILGFDDLNIEVAFTSADEVMTLTVRRGEETLDVPVKPRYAEAVGRPEIGVSAALLPEAAGVDAGSPAEKAGGRAGDVILTVQGEPVDGFYEAREKVRGLTGRAGLDAKELAVDVRVRHDDGTEEDLEIAVPLSEFPFVGIQPASGQRIVSLVHGTDAAAILRVDDRILAVNGAAIPDIQIFSAHAADAEDAVHSITIERGGERMELTRIPEGLTRGALARSVAGRIDMESPQVAPLPGLASERAGMHPGDRVIAVGDAAVATYDAIRTRILAAGRKPLVFTVERAGSSDPIRLEIEPGAYPHEYDVFGYQFRAAQIAHRETHLLSAIATGWRRTRLTMEQVLLTIRGLVTRRVSAENIGGPIFLAQITYTVQESGWGRFLYILAMISINLAILNLLPIPVLDGGQIVLLCAEKIRGKPLPDRLVGYFQLVGLVFILGLMALAFTNDITRLLR